MRKFTSLIIAILLSHNLFSQLGGNYERINDTPATLNTCGGGLTGTTFSDSRLDTSRTLGVASGWHYSNNEDYTRTFCSDNGENIAFDFSTLVINSGDYLRVYDGATTGDPLIYEWTNTDVAPGFIFSSGTCMTFHFTSDNNTPSGGLFGGGHNGNWAATISCIDPVSIDEPGTVTGCGYAFTDDGFLGDYSANANYTKTFCPSNGACIGFEYQDFDLEDGVDFLEIYEGPDATGIPMITYTGSSLPSPASFDGNKDQCYTFKFTSNGSVNRSGWMIYITCPDACVPPCNPNSPLAGDDCANATPICDLNGYCGNTTNCVNDPNGYSPDYPGNFCSGGGSDDCGVNVSGTSGCDLFSGSIENNSWLKFVAGDTEALFNVYVRNCEGGSSGIQIGIYEGNNCDGFVLKSNVSLTSGGIGDDGASSVSGTDLTPGQVYYIMVDGLAGAVCDYTVEAVSGVQLGVNISPDQTICEGQTAIIDVTGSIEGLTVNWTSTPAGYAGTGASITVQPDEDMTYTTHLTSVSGFCTFDTTIETSVFVLPPDDPSCMADVTCDITAGADEDEVCAGETVNLTANGSIVETLMANTFDDGTVGVGWTGGATANFSNPCGNTPPYGTNYCWMDNTTAAPRTLMTNNFDVHNGGTISFWLRYAEDTFGGFLGGQDDEAPCEGVDQADEGVALQYSLDDGATWEYIIYFNPNTGQLEATNPQETDNDDQGGTSVFTVWDRYSFDIPPAAVSANTRFRWWQEHSSDENTDNWGIDSVMIVSPPDATEIVWTSNPIDPTLNTNPVTGTENNTSVQPTVDTWYYATISNPGGYSCIDSVFVAVSHISAGIDVNEDEHCLSGNNFIFTNTGETGANITWDFGDGGTSSQENPTHTYANAGTYTVTQTISTGGGSCTATADTTITVHPQPSITLTPDSVCDGMTTGSITATTPPGAATPYYFTWADSPDTSTVLSHDQNLSGLSDGTYTLYYKNTHGCMETASATVGLHEAVTLTTSGSDVLCHGGNTGEAEVTVNTGTSPFTYQWSANTGSQSTEDISGLIADSYYVSVTDINGCAANDSVIIAEPSELTSYFSNISHVDCNGNNNGSATINVSGGTPGYTYLWPDNSSSHMHTSLSGGTYTVTVTDDNECIITNDTTINEPPALIIDTVIQTDIECHGDGDGKLEITASGGTPPIEYNIGTGWSSNNVFENLDAFVNYTVQIRDSNGCSVQGGSYSIFEPSGISISNINTTNILCFGDDTARIIVTASGGSGRLNYTWSNNVLNYTDSLATNLSAGTYSVTVTDENNCSTLAETTIGQPTQLEAAITDIEDPLCHNDCNGSATIIAEEGTPGYSYSWDNGINIASNNSLCSGSTGYTVTDYNGCFVSGTVNLNNPDTIIIDNITANDADCYGYNNGLISVSASGGTGTQTLTYTISNGLPQSSGLFTDLTPGNYYVTVTDTNECTVVSDAVNIDEPDELEVSITTTEISCHNGSDGSAVATATGGNGTNTFAWSNNLTSDSISNLSSGTYIVTVTDYKGCPDIDSVFIDNPGEIIITTPSNFVLCKGDELLINNEISGGTPPYSWEVNGQPGSDPYITTTDSSGYFKYRFIAYDSKDCPSNRDTALVTVLPALNFNLLINRDSVCPGDPVTITPEASGGSGTPYTFYDSDGNMISPNGVVRYPDNSRDYVFTIEDSQCGYKDARIEVFVYTFPPIVPQANRLRGCAPLTVQFNDASSNSNLTYNWSFGDGAPNSDAPTPIHVFENPGEYDISLSVTSEEGCTQSKTITDMIKAFPSPEARFTFESNAGNNAGNIIRDPKIDFNNTSEDCAYALWAFGDGDSSNVYHPTHLYGQAGYFTVTLIAESANGCKDTTISKVKINDEYTFYTPDAIRPSSRDENAIFRPFGHGINTEEGYLMIIYDRWGEIIFQTDNWYEGWDGRVKGGAPAELGTYSWLIQFRDIMGAEHLKAGDVTIIK